MHPGPCAFLVLNSFARPYRHYAINQGFYVMCSASFQQACEVRDPVTVRFKSRTLLDSCPLIGRLVPHQTGREIQKIPILTGIMTRVT
jgi:hypothetical protein